jgi:hypothetical protein
MNQIPINTSFTGHKKCFICRQRATSLKEVSKKSIAIAFVHHNVYIPEGTRTCRNHVKNAELIDTEYSKIPTHINFLERKYIKSLSSLFQKTLECYDKEKINENPPIHPLERFRNFTVLSDDFCREFIGWPIDTFRLFSSFLNKKIRNTKNRSKTMLLALYLYWLRSGMSQKSLAFFKNESTQQEISQELKHIRIYVYRDITSRYLGCQNITREFLQNHVTPTVKELYNIRGDQLVFILDGGYQRHEKSFNNEFQSATFSGQKKQNLLKPFLVTTTTGYIIECYVDMDATWNDDRILREILAKDRHLRSIIRKNDYFFLDR